MNELFETEEKYYEDLIVIIHLWLKVLKEENILDSSEIPLLFGNIELIKSFHEGIINKINEIIENFLNAKSQNSFCFNLSQYFNEIVKFDFFFSSLIP